VRFPVFYSIFNCCLIAGNRATVQNCHYAHVKKSQYRPSAHLQSKAFIAELTTVLLLESDTGCEIVTQLQDTKKRRSLHLYFMEQSPSPMITGSNDVNHDDI
jgi:hypothetical protein